MLVCEQYASMDRRRTHSSSRVEPLAGSISTQNLLPAGIGSGALNELQTLTVTAVSSNPSIVAAPVVGYGTPAPTGTLTVTAAAAGTAVITVTVEATEEAVINALTAATTVVGRDNYKVEAISLSRLRAILGTSSK